MSNAKFVVSNCDTNRKSTHAGLDRVFCTLESGTRAVVFQDKSEPGRISNFNHQVPVKFESSKFRDYLRPTPHQVEDMRFEAGEPKNRVGLNQVPGLPVTCEGAPWFEHGTYRSAVDCSTTELYTQSRHGGARVR